MTLYVHLESGVVDYGPAELPKSWRHVSGLHLADADTLSANNWHVATVVQDPVDPATQNHGPENVVLNADGTVTITRTAVDLDAAGLALREMQIAHDELQAIDAVLPRFAEDIISAAGINEALLPAIMRDRLARKRAARAKVQN